MHRKTLYKITRKNICITIPIETDEYLEKFILDNAFMRNQIRNDFVEEANKYKGPFNMYYDFDPWKFKNVYLNTVEFVKNSDGDIIKDRYLHYCVGLSAQVSNDLKTAIASMQTKNQKILDRKKVDKDYNAKLGEFYFKKFDYNRYTFRVELSHGKYNDVFYTRLNIIDCRHIEFRVRGHKFGRSKEVIPITFKEPLYDDKINSDDTLYIRHYNSNNKINGCSFRLSDIKDICFKYECGKYYVLLFIEADYSINKSSRKYSKDRVCGIDTGIRHPVTLYDGNKTMYLSMDDKTTRKIHYLERRIGRLKHYRSLKYNANEERTGYKYSNNTIKLTKKIRKLYRKITNIKNFWIQNRCKEIATTYSKICVDKFEQPEHSDEEKKKISKKALRKINYANRFHKMYYFNEFLKHDCIKYGCEYIESPEDTTRTCSICGHINDHLPLDKTHLICTKCKTPIERDMNAARNCYYYLLDNA